MTANKNVELSLIGSRQCAFHRAIDELFALPVSLQRVAQNEMRICTYYRIFVAGNCRHFKFGMQIDHSKLQPMYDELSLKGAWSCHVIHFEFQGPKHTSGITEARIIKFLTLVGYI